MNLISEKQWKRMSCRVSSWSYCHLDLSSFWDCLGFLFGLVQLVLFSQYFLIPGTGLESPMTGDGNDIIMQLPCIIT